MYQINIRYSSYNPVKFEGDIAEYEIGEEHLIVIKGIGCSRDF